VGTPAGEDDLQRRIRLKLGEIDEIKEWHSLQDQIVQANAAKNAEEARRLCQEQQALTERLVAALRRRGDIYWIFVASNWDSMGDHTEAKAFIGDMLAKSQTPTPFELAFIKHYAPELAPDK
jgi:FtsZ-binding cell division protein ZapB